MLSTHRTSLTGAVLLAAALGLAGCSDGPASKSGGSTGGKTAGASGDSITIKNFNYSPSPLKVKVGQKITVTNSDSATHTITSDDGKSFDSKNLMQGKSFSFTIAKAGKYTYICDIHQYMKGEIDAS